MLKYTDITQNTYIQFAVRMKKVQRKGPLECRVVIVVIDTNR